MTFWSSEKLHSEQCSYSIFSDYKFPRVKHGAYELSLGERYYTTDSPEGKTQTTPKGEQISISPGQFALLLTEEVITIPKHAIGFISIKAGVKFRGLINISGFHVDPGFKGHLKFGVYNAGSAPISLTVGKPLFLIWLADLDRVTKDPYSNGSELNTITNTDIMSMQGKIASPSALDERIATLETKAKIGTWALASLFLVFMNFLSNFTLQQILKLLGIK